MRLAACSVMGFKVDLTEMIMIMGLVFSKNVPQSRAWWIMLLTLTFQRHVQKCDLSWEQPGEERKCQVNLCCCVRPGLKQGSKQRKISRWLKENAFPGNSHFDHVHFPSYIYYFLMHENMGVGWPPCLYFSQCLVSISRVCHTYSIYKYVLVVIIYNWKIQFLYVTFHKRLLTQNFLIV